MSETRESADAGVLAELAGVGYFQVDEDRNLVAVSAEMERITGFPADEVVGRSCLTLIRCRECLKGCGVFDRGRVQDARLQLYRKDGSEVEVLRSGRALRDGEGRVVGALETVRLADEPGPGCRAVPAELDTLLGALGRVFVAADAELRIVAYSPSLEPMLGRPEGSLQGERLEAVLGPELFGPGGVLREAVRAGKRREGWRARLVGSAGRSLPVSLSVGPVGSDDPCGHPAARVLVMIRPESEGEHATQDVPTFHGMVGRSPSMQRIFRLIELLRDNDATVLISGESGTGKELVARALHATSHRASGPFIAVNCAALPAELLESELFGHVRGAFTGAVRDRPGRFELADGGTLFLDEIGDLAPALQAKLLRAIQDRSFERVGDTRTRHVDVRVVAATNRDLGLAVAAQRFREDLYYRLRVIPIEIPPLRLRREDLPLLIPHILQRIGERHHRALRLAPTASRALLAYAWPGNVRELENALEFATTVCEGQTVHVTDLPPEIGAAGDAGNGTAVPMAGPVQHGPSQTGEPLVPASVALSDAEAAEAASIASALRQVRFRREAAAAALGMSRTTLWRKMKQYGLSG